MARPGPLKDNYSLEKKNSLHEKSVTRRYYRIIIDAIIEVMSVTDLLIVSADLTDVTLVSDDTY